ncbi:MAG: tartrate-resistant acid phosphatase type 5 family protein [Bacteroidota bacterium]
MQKRYPGYAALRAVSVLAMLLCITTLGSAQNTVSFFVIGDWGTGGAGAKQVGRAMAAQHETGRVDAILTTGDNIYPSGVKSVDDPQWQSKFECVFPEEVLPVPFWAVLGNHDYRSNPDAQIEYTGHLLSDGNTTRWHMPGRMWSTVFRSSGAAVRVRVVGIDTQQLVGSAALRKAHLQWLDSVLASAREEWIIVVGHHPVYSHGYYGNTKVLVKYLAPMFEKYRVSAYLDGHEHDLQLLKRINGVRYIVSGGGGGKRKTVPGINTEFSASTLGFVRLDFDAKHLRILVFDSNGERLHGAVDPGR